MTITLTLTALSFPHYSLNMAKGDEITPAEYTVDRNSIQLRADCTKNLLVIRWKNLEEPNVTGFKIHSNSTKLGSDESINRWINPIALAAKGSDERYTIIDADFSPNTLYTFRLYGFEQNNLLSKAKQITLNDNFARYCARFPITITQN